jgi:hypothetical protein
MFESVPARLVPVKLKGPPGKRVVTFCTATCGMAGFTMLVNTHVICARARMFVPGMVITLPESDPNVPEGLPEATEFASEHEADEIVKFAARDSVMVTAVPLVVASMGESVVG